MKKKHGPTDEQLAAELKQRPLLLRVDPDSVLRQTAVSVRTFDDSLEAFINEMMILMQERQGLGLAAPQVGVLQRIIVVNTDEDPIGFVNPEILTFPGSSIMLEGCLSLPDVQVDVMRNAKIEIRGKDSRGEELYFEAEGLLARILQHEVDHLNGVLICDYGPPEPLT